MTKQKDNSNANTKPSADPRLKTVTALIEKQLLPVKEVLADFAKAMLDNTSNLNNRIKSLGESNATIAGCKRIIPRVEHVSSVWREFFRMSARPALRENIRDYSVQQAIFFILIFTPCMSRQSHHVKRKL